MACLRVLGPYHSANLPGILVGTLILWHSFNSPLFDTIPASESLQFGIKGVANHERLAMDSTRLIRNDTASMLLGSIMFDVVGPFSEIHYRRWTLQSM